MKISLKPQHLKRYRQIASLMLRFGFSELVRSSGLEDLLGEDLGRITQRAHPKPSELVHELEAMGPTFVKLGQVMSTRGDLIPVEYIRALTTLQDKVEPEDFEQIEQVVHEEFGQPLSKIFLTFEPTPLAAASLGQVHRATLQDGREVAVKVQRPGIRAKLADDLDVLDEVASTLETLTQFAERYRFKGIVNEFRRTLMRELDYRTEASNLTTLGHNLEEFPELFVPQPIEEYTTSRVLAMDFVKGRKITELTDEDRAGINGAHLAEQLQKAYMKQFCIDGFFHADPHPGNVMLMPEGRIALLDLGMVGRVSVEMRERLLRLLIALGEGRPEQAADLAVKIGHPGSDFREREFRDRIKTLVNAYQGAIMEGIELGRVVMDLARAAGDTGMHPPSELTMIGKALMNLDELGRSLAPGFDPYEAIRRSAIPLVLKMMRQTSSPAALLGRALEVNEFANQLPGRVNKILDRVAENRLEFKVRSFNEQQLVEGFQKVANRIAHGLVVAALIVGAAMLMGIESRFTIFGYPGFAILLFVGAVGGGVALVWDILRHDRRKK
ncbi:MAG: AarF/ABC1/UbiB kinase family protein [Planctomycetes bacterium]|nr:AarF/ABC1/UbiB kinase family protein [Planctomycetota bacterium]MCB9935498.1 AarF/ABC1/UbiB kinase family protein [Planctomycetota bacterium]